MLIHLRPTSSSSYSFLLFLLLLLTVSLSNVESAADSPIVDSSHVPSRVNDYGVSSAPIVNNFNSIVGAPVRSELSAWLLTDQRFLYSFNIAPSRYGPSYRIVDSKPNALQTTNTSNTSTCSQPFISPTSNNGNLTLYIICQQNLIYTVGANDTTGEFTVDYDTPIQVNFASSNEAATPNITTSTLAVKQQNGGIGPDLLIVSGSGAIFVIDSSTGQHARHQYGPNNTSLGTHNLLTQIQFIASDVNPPPPSPPWLLPRLFCSGIDTTGQFIAFVLEWPTTPTEQWNVVWKTTLSGTGWSAIQMHETPNSVHFHLLGRSDLIPPLNDCIYRLDKSTYSFRSMINIAVSPLGTLTQIYEAPSLTFNGNAVAIGGQGKPIWKLDFFNSKVERVYHSYIALSTAYIDASRGLLYFFMKAQLAVTDMSTILADARIDDDMLWNYYYLAQVGYLGETYPAISFDSSVRVGPGASGTNSLLVYSPVTAWNGELHVRLQLLSSMIAPPCSTLDMPASATTFEAMQCWCGRLTNSWTPRNCVFDGNSSCTDSSEPFDTSSCPLGPSPPSNPDQPSDRRWTTIGIIIATVSIGFVLLVFFCCWLHRRKISELHNRGGAGVIGAQHQQPMEMPPIIAPFAVRPAAVSSHSQQQQLRDFSASRSPSLTNIPYDELPEREDSTSNNNSNI